MRVIPLLNLAVMAVLLPAAPAVASGDDKEAAAAADPKDRMVCKRTQKTGTRFYDKVCKTAAQWDALAEQHRRDLAETVNRPQIETRRE